MRFTLHNGGKFHTTFDKMIFWADLVNPPDFAKECKCFVNVEGYDNPLYVYETIEQLDQLYNEAKND